MSDSADFLVSRVLVVMPTRRDVERTTVLLQEGGLSSFACDDLVDMCRELRSGAGALLLTEEVISGDAVNPLVEAMRSQPPWSILPVVVVAREGAGQQVERNVAELLQGLIIIERPLRARTLLSVLHSALRGRRNQYQIRDAMLIQQQQAEELRAQGERLRAALATLQEAQTELANQATQLRSADRRKDEFLATLAHELRNPLAPIQTGLDLLSATRDRPPSSRALGVMNRQLRHMVRLIDDLLDVSRITQGKLELKRSQVRLAEVLDTAVEASRPFIERSSQTLNFAGCDPTLLIDADATRIAQVVSNLLNNASKYTPVGGTVELTATRAGGEAVIQVKDDGIGIPAAYIDHVFEMFSQVNRAMERAQGGLGIGLALVRSLVEMHGGKVSASSPGSGLGSTFVVKLPLASGVEQGTAPSSSAQPFKGRKRRIVVVDDNDDAADLLAVMLNLAEYEATKAHDGPTGLAEIEAQSPEVVILDIGLPGMSGYDVARELRRDARFEKLKLIALSGWGSQEDKQKALEAGFDLHLTKPVDAEKLHGALAQLEAL